jgi:hypothetical protein
MQICRREFVIGTLSVVPALAVLGLPASAALAQETSTAAGEVESTGRRFAIDGWDVAADGAGDQVLIRLNSSWRAAWL